MEGCSRMLWDFFQRTLSRSGLDEQHCADCVMLHDSRCVSVVSRTTVTFFGRDSKVRNKIS